MLVSDSLVLEFGVCLSLGGLLAVCIGLYVSWVALRWCLGLLQLQGSGSEP